MSNKMEDLLGLGTFDKERKIPGTIKSSDREYLYLSVPNDMSFEVLFKKVVRYVTPPLVKGGGVGIEGCKITLPNSVVFEAISYKDDLEGWREQISQGAKANNVQIAVIDGEELRIEAGDKYLLSQCQIDFN